VRSNVWFVNRPYLYFLVADSDEFRRVVQNELPH
jgi:hypothetical protein